MQKSAVIDTFWRYRLDRIWAPEKGMVAFVMLNPSTADAEQDDATVRRCLGYARDWGFGHLAVVNLYAYRATDPKDLREAIQNGGPDDSFNEYDPLWAVGPDNAKHVTEVLAQAKLVVAAWGAHAQPGRAEAMRATFRGLRIAVGCLGWTKGGQPVHPLRQPRDAKWRSYYAPPLPP